jgi:group I intron endonuclease
MRKHAPRSNSSIYKITNLINDKCYIGSAIDPKTRFYVHKSHLRKNKHHSILLQRAWNKYGENSFIFEVIEECPADDLIIREQYYIDTIEPVYNIARIAGNCLGVKFSKESSIKKSINNARKGIFGKDNPSSIIIFQYDLSGKFLKEWGGLREISRTLNFDPANIGKASKDSTRTCYGYFWSRVFLGDGINPVSPRNRKKCQKPIEMLDDCGNVIRTFDSQKDAVLFFGIRSNGNINAALQNANRKTNGHRWRYKQDD